MQQLGWTSFSFDWLVNPDRAIYTVVIAGVWQSAGFAMALFLPGCAVSTRIIRPRRSMVRRRDNLRRIIIPTLRPVFFSVTLILAHIAIKSFDLVMALTGGGPGTASDVPAIFMYQFSFNRGQLGVGAASAVMMLDDHHRGDGAADVRRSAFGAGAHPMNRVARYALYGVLLLVALYALAPMWVMVATSLKSLDEIREGSLIAAPHA